VKNILAVDSLTQIERRGIERYEAAIDKLKLKVFGHPGSLGLHPAPELFT